MPSQIITTRAGKVEIETFGTGVPILVLHGSPCGIDGARIQSRFLPEDRFKTICLSRPGYLGTPLHPTNPSIDQEADLLAAVLDALNIDRVGVLAWSGGGPAAYRFAVLHPSRVSNILAISAVSFRWVAPKPNMVDKFMFGTGFGERAISFLCNRYGDQFVEAALENEGSLRGEELRILTKQVLADPEQRQLVLDISQTVNISGARKAGWLNDVANFAKIDSLELHLVKCPVLLVHGNADTDGPIEHSYHANSKLPDSTLIIMERGTHLCFYAHPEATSIQQRAQEWLLEHR